MQVVCRKCAYALFVALAVLGVTLLTSGRANAQSPATITPESTGYFECAADSSYTLGGYMESGGILTWSIYIDGSYFTGGDVYPYFEPTGTVEPYDIDDTVPGTALVGTHECEFKMVENEPGPPPAYPTQVTVFDITAQYNFVLQ